MKPKEIFENVRILFKNWARWDRKGIVWLLVRIPALVIMPLITAFIPKAMIDSVTNGVSVGQLTLTIAGLSVAVALLTWLDPFTWEIIVGSSRVVQIKYAISAFDKIVTADFMEIESIDGREKNKNASNFYSEVGWLSQFAYCSCSIIVSVIGVLTSVVLIYKVNFVIILLILLSALGEFFLLKKLNKANRKTWEQRSALWVKLDYFYELSKDRAAAKDIRLYGFADYFIMSYARIVAAIDGVQAKYMRRSAQTSGTRAALNLMRETVAYAYLVFMVTRGDITPADFIFYFGVITGFSNWIVGLVYSWSNIERACGQFKVYRDFVENGTNGESGRESAGFSEVESIEFDSVSFRYPSAGADTLKSMSFKVNKGENIAIVGENGAGKTTAIKLLCGLYYPTGGDIRVNGKSSRDFSRESYFDLFSPVFQDCTFMPITVAQNVSGEFEPDRERLLAALDKAGIGEKIASLPEKENTKMIKDVYPDAADFSGGEKQKLLLARAIYKNAPVLILDEPTAALDPIAENELYLKYSEMTDGKISFFISHRLSSTRFCDRIIFISDGKIAEIGTHEELMAKRGKYYRMYQIQSYYYRENREEALV